MDFDAFHSDVKQAMHEQLVCRDGYAALLRAHSTIELADVIRQYWADLNHDLWPVFQRLLQQYYAECRSALIHRNIRYNEDADRGLCVVDDSSPGSIVISGRAEVVVHGNASVSATDSAVVSLLDAAQAVVSNMVRVTAWQHSLVHATGSATVRAFDDSFVVADGAVTIHISDNATIHNVRSLRIYDSRDAVKTKEQNNISNN